MRATTAQQVVAILDEAEAILERGRPRKPLGGKRPWIDTKGNIALMNLPAALRLAAIKVDANEYQLQLAKNELRWAYYESKPMVELPSVDDIDSNELDTREIRRAARAAARWVRKLYLS